MKVRVVVLQPRPFNDRNDDDPALAFLAYLPAFPNDLLGEGPTRDAAVDALLATLQAKLIEPAGERPPWERQQKPTTVLRDTNAITRIDRAKKKRAKDSL